MLDWKHYALNKMDGVHSEKVYRAYSFIELIALWFPNLQWEIYLLIIVTVRIFNEEGQKKNGFYYSGESFKEW